MDTLAHMVFMGLADQIITSNTEGERKHPIFISHPVLSLYKPPDKHDNKYLHIPYLAQDDREHSLNFGSDGFILHQRTCKGRNYYNITQMHHL